LPFIGTAWFDRALALMRDWLLLKFLGRSRDGRDRVQGHITFGQTSIGRTMSRTGLMLKKQLWIWPIVAVVLLAIVGYAVSGSIQHTMEDNLRSQMTTLLNVERSMLEKWLKVQESSALTLANSQEIRKTVTQLLASSVDSTLKADPAATAVNPRDLTELHSRLGKELEPAMSAHDFVGFVVADKQLRIVGATYTELIGQTVPQYESFLTRTL
jgi:hypothetical protein